MFEEHRNIWIHLAGNPPGVMNQNPPYWRFRLGPNGTERLLHTWVISEGLFDGTNNTQGIQLDASFLLWYAIYGSIRIQDRGDQKPAAHIFLKPGPGGIEAPFRKPVQRYENTDIEIYGAPDRVKQESALWWRCRVNGKEIDLAQWRVHGPARSIDNNGHGEDITHSNPLRRLWLHFHGTLEVDEYSNGAIQLI